MIIYSDLKIDWFLIAIIILGVIVINLLIGLILFLFSFSLEKKIKQLDEPISKLSIEKNKEINELISLFLEEYETPLIDLTSYIDGLHNSSTLSSSLFMQETITIIIKKDVDNEKITPSDKLVSLINKSSDFTMFKESVNKFNKAAMKYNAFRKYLFARPFFAIAHKNSFSLI